MAFPATPLDVTVEMAIGENPDGDPTAWSWTDITDYVLTRAGVTITRGAGDRFSTTAPASCTLTLNNDGGRFVVRNPRGAYFPDLRRNVPIRVSIDSVPRFTGFVDNLPVEWDVSGNDKYVPAKAFGVLKRLGRSKASVASAPRTFINTTDPIAYWPLEDGPLAGYGKPDVGINRLVPWTGKHPSGAVATFPRWGEGNLGPWLPPVFSFPPSSGLAILAARVDMPDTATTWTVDFMYAGSTGSDGIEVDVNPSYLTNNPAGWPQLSLDPSNGLLLAAFNGEPETSSSVPGLFDGLGHHVRLTAIQDGSNVSWTAYVDGVLVQSDTTSGSMTLPPIEMIGLVGDQADRDALGHVAVWKNPPSVVAAAAAGLGYPGERAGRRIERACGEQGVPLVVVDEFRIRDTFDRTSSNSWGSTDTGEVWTLSGGSANDFDVAAGEGTIAQGSTQVVRAAVLGTAVDTFDVKVAVEAAAVSSGGSVGIHAGIVFRWVSDSDHYRAQINFDPGGGMNFGLARAGGAGVGFGTTVALDGSYTAGTRMWIRVRGTGSLFFAKAWRDGDVEPVTWDVIRDDDELATGLVGVFARRGVSDTTSSNTYTFSAFSADSALDDTQPMGPQPYQALIPVLREAESVDGGVLAEATTGEIEYLVGRDRYNRPVDLALDYDEGHVAPPFQPADDDSGIRNDVVATQTGGSSSARYVDEAHVLAEGRYDEPFPVNATEDRLDDQAAWQVHLGTVPEQRYPALSIKFHRNPSLSADWLACRLSSRLTVDNPPPELPPDLIDQHIVGYTETFDQFGWDVTANCEPASPYTVGIWEDDTLGRADTDGTVTAAAFVAGTGTSLQVAVTAGHPWVTTAGNPDEFPFDVTTGGAVLTVTGITAATVLNSNPNFETNVTGWTTAGGGTFARSTAQSHQGSASGLRTPGGVSAAAEVFSDLCGVVPGVSYTASSWVWCAAARNVQVAVYWYTAGSVFVSSDITTTAVPATTWTLITSTADAPDTAPQARINIIMTGTPPNTHLLYVDESKLYPTGGQTFTVTQAAVNGATNTVPAGTDVRLTHPMIAGL